MSHPKVSFEAGLPGLGLDDRQLAEVAALRSQTGVSNPEVEALVDSPEGFIATHPLDPEAVKRELADLALPEYFRAA